MIRTPEQPTTASAGAPQRTPTSPASNKICFVGSFSAKTVMTTQTMAAWSGSVTARHLSLKTTPKTMARWMRGLNVAIVRCAARISVWIFRQLTEIQTAQQNAQVMLCAITGASVSEPGWMPPDCTSEDGSSSLHSTGKIIAIVVTVILVVLGIIAGAVGFIWKKRQSPVLPTPHTQRKNPAVESSAYRLNKGPVPNQPMPVLQDGRPKPRGAPPPPPPAGNRPKPPVQNYIAARQALRPVPPPIV